MIWSFRWAPVELGLSGHDRSHRCASRHSVNRARKVKLGLHAPQPSCWSGERKLRWIARRDPADRHDCPRVQLGVDVEHAVESQFHSAAGDRSGKQRCAGRNENLVLDCRSIDVGVRPDEHRIADWRWDSASGRVPARFP